MSGLVVSNELSSNYSQALLQEFVQVIVDELELPPSENVASEQLRSVIFFKQ